MLAVFLINLFASLFNIIMNICFMVRYFKTR